MAGDVVADRYELEQLVGSGGMSSVFRAHDRVLERTVALKVLHERLTSQPGRRRPLQPRGEARRRALAHNIVAVIDRGEYDGSPFIVFEYIAGENLKQLDRPRRPAARRPGARARDRDRARPRVRAPERVRPPRRQAAERPPERQGRGEGDRLRHRRARSRRARSETADRHRARHLRLHLARAGAGPARRRAHRRLLARHRPLRAPHRRGAVHRRQLRRRRDAAHQHAAAARQPQAARGAPARRGGDRQGARQGSRPSGSRRWPPSSASSRPASPRSAKAATIAPRPGSSPSSSPGARRRRPGSAAGRWPIALALLLVLAAVAVGAALVWNERRLGHGNGRQPAGPARRSRQSASYDPFGNNHVESPTLVAERDRREPGHLLVDRDLLQQRARQAGRRDRPRRRLADRRAHPHRHLGDARLPGRDPQQRQPPRPASPTTRRPGPAARRTTFDLNGNEGPLLPDLDHEPRRPLVRSGSTRSRRPVVDVAATRGSMGRMRRSSSPARSPRSRSPLRLPPPGPRSRSRPSPQTDLPLGQVVWTGSGFLYLTENSAEIDAVDATGAGMHPFATFPGTLGGEEVRCAVPVIAYWPDGIYCHLPDNRIYRIARDGSSMALIAQLPGSVLSDGALAFDSSGKFGYALLAATGGSASNGGEVYAVRRDGRVQDIGGYPGPGGADEIAIAPTRFGPASGRLLISIDEDSKSGRVLAIDRKGNVQRRRERPRERRQPDRRDPACAQDAGRRQPGRRALRAGHELDCRVLRRSRRARAVRRPGARRERARRRLLADRARQGRNGLRHPSSSTVDAPRREPEPRGRRLRALVTGACRGARAARAPGRSAARAGRRSRSPTPRTGSRRRSSA